MQKESFAKKLVTPLDATYGFLLNMDMAKVDTIGDFANVLQRCDKFYSGIVNEKLELYAKKYSDIATKPKGIIKSIIHDTKEIVLRNTLYELFSEWITSRAKIYMKKRAISLNKKYANAPTADRFKAQTEGIETYYHELWENLIFLVGKQDIEEPDMFALRVGMHIRSELLAGLKNLTRDPRINYPLYAMNARSAKKDAVQYRKFIEQISLKLVTGHVTDRKVYEGVKTGKLGMLFHMKEMDLEPSEDFIAAQKLVEENP